MQFTENDRAFVTRAEQSLKTGLDILYDVLFKDNNVQDTEQDIKSKIFEIEKKIKEALEHLKEIKR